MPRIEQRFIGTSLYLYKTEESAEKGMQSGGSGVLIGYPSEGLPTLVHLYAVTNAHVVEAGGVVPRAMKRDGYSRIFPLSRSDWELHPKLDDVAVCWLGTTSTDDDQELQWVPRDWFATEDDFGLVATRTDWPFPWETGPVVPGEETFSVGRFIGFDGKESNQPTVRFGNLSSGEVIRVEQKKRGREQDSFLVEARSLLGYSGAPVYAYRTGSYWGGGVPPVAQALMLGIGWAHVKHPVDERVEYEVEVETFDELTPGRYNSGIMAVVPAWKIADLLDEPKVIEMRRKIEDEALNEGVELDVANDNDEFRRFEDAAKKVVAVPKSEIAKPKKEK